LASSTTKKVLVRRYDRETLAGFINPSAWLQPEGVELMSPEGMAVVVPYREIKQVAFVREFEGGGEERQVFQTRPKMEGLWVRVRFRDGEVIEGIIPNNLLQVEPAGITLTPPDSTGNQQRIFVPRLSSLAVEVLGVVGSPLKKTRPKAAAKEQIGLFEE
jgi:hypothetical protein